MSSKQQLQRDREYFKFVVSGINKPINKESLTKFELEAWNIILDKIELLVKNHDNCSRTLGLRVPEHKCWCGKTGKYYIQVGADNDPDRFIWVCNKHKEL